VHAAHLQERTGRAATERLEDPAKRWRFRAGDLEERKRWDDYMAAFSDALAETSTEGAPWYVIPADRNWHRNWVVLTLLVETLRAMDPQFPQSEEGLDSIVVE
jgi:polyphosphate kinase 2 (PPK2 family)